MKYFTEELWSKFNSGDPQISNEADIQWQANAKAYQEMFKSLGNRFSKKTFELLSKNSFHDLQLVNLQIIHGRYGLEYPVSVILSIGNREKLWHLQYKKVMKLQIDYEPENFVEGRGFHDWGYDEFIAIDDDALSHEILFASGAKILIYFINKGLSIKMGRN